MMEAADLRGEKLIVMTVSEYNELIEDAGDIALLEDALHEDRDAPGLPADLLEASLNGTLHPLAAWRQATGLTQAALAGKAGVRAATISDIEGRRIDPRLSTLKALATALHLGIEDIVD